MARITNLPERRAIIATALEMNGSGVNQGTSGNISMRVEGGFLITPSGVPYGEIEPEDIVEMAMDATYLGDKRPSSEWRFHRDILAARPDIEVVLHAHPIHATALATHRRDIPAFHYMVGVAGGTNIRCSDYATFGTQELSNHAVAALRDRLACLLGNHGMICVAKTLKHAMWLAIEVETLAKQYLLALSIGQPFILDDEEMARVLEQMRRMSYGQAPDLDPDAETPKPRAVA